MFPSASGLVPNEGGPLGRYYGSGLKRPNVPPPPPLYLDPLGFHVVQGFNSEGAPRPQWG